MGRHDETGVLLFRPSGFCGGHGPPYGLPNCTYSMVKIDLRIWRMNLIFQEKYRKSGQDFGFFGVTLM